jgi:septal ring factor EnvC (AmiA/AmiB activator)
LFAGPYHKTGEALILETGGGYDVVLAGLARVNVRSGDAVLAGEPLGRMPGEIAGGRLYVELRHNGRFIDPAKSFGLDARKVKRS